MDAQVKVVGYRELARAFDRMGPETRKELRRELRAAGEVVKTAAQETARSVMNVQTGDLSRRIRITASQRSVSIVANATHRGYGYPRRHEFENGGARAFLRPALEQHQDEAVENIADAFERVGRDNGF